MTRDLASMFTNSVHRFNNCEGDYDSMRIVGSSFQKWARGAPLRMMTIARLASATKRIPAKMLSFLYSGRKVPKIITQYRGAKVPRDWGNWFVISWVRYIENLVVTNFRKNNQCVSGYSTFDEPFTDTLTGLKDFHHCFCTLVA